MQQRRVRLGDILDDYCPRERRITNHAVVAMIDDEVKQTRCTTCQSDHEYKGARTPPPRRRKTGALSGEDAETVIRPRAAVPVPNTPEPGEELTSGDPVDTFAEAQPEPDSDSYAPAASEHAEPETGPDADGGANEEHDEWPVHRPLIRATLPRPEGQTPERKAPDFTFRPAGGRFDSPRNGKRHRGHRPARQGQGQQGGGGQGRFQGPRQGSGQGSPHGPRHGSGRPRQGGGQGAPPAQRQGPGGGRPAQGRGPRQGSGPGRKRGR